MDAEGGFTAGPSKKVNRRAVGGMLECTCRTHNTGSTAELLATGCWVARVDFSCTYAAVSYSPRSCSRSYFDCCWQPLADDLRKRGMPASTPAYGAPSHTDKLTSGW